MIDKKMRVNIISIGVAVCMSFLLIMQVSGLVGIAPATVTYMVMKGEQSEKNFYIQNSGAEEIMMNVSVYCTDNISNEWFSFEPSGVFVIPADTTKTLKAILTVPENTPNGLYECGIQAVPIVGDETKNGTGMGGTWVIGASAKAKINVSGDEITDTRIYKIDASNTEVGKPVIFSVNIRNFGNVKIKPKIRVDVKKENEVLDVVEEISTNYVSPGTGDTIKINWSAVNITVGNYLAHFDIFVGDKRLDASAYIIDTGREKNITIGQDVNFTVYEAGTFTKTGIVVEASADQEINTGDISKIVVKFKNTGAVEITAKLKTEVYSGDKLIDVPESNPVSIYPADTGPLTAYFTKSDNPGTYVIKGRVIYENKEAQFEDITINVKSKSDANVEPRPVNSSNPQNPDQPAPSDNSLLIILMVGFIIVVAIGVFILKRR